MTVDSLTLEVAFRAAFYYMLTYWKIDPRVTRDAVLERLRYVWHLRSGDAWEEWEKCWRDAISENRNAPPSYGIQLQRGSEIITLTAIRPNGRDIQEHESSDIVVSPDQTFQAMYLYLESAPVGRLLGDVLSDSQLAGPGATSDPAAWYDWLHCVQKTMEGSAGIP